VTAASAQLRLAAPTISAQIKKLEDSLGEKLLERSGRRLVLTEEGRLVMSYADEIFSLGQELRSAIKDRPTGRPLRLVVGIADVLPKWIAYRLIEPALHLGERVQVICRESVQPFARRMRDQFFCQTGVGPGVAAAVPTIPARGAVSVAQRQHDVPAKPGSVVRGAGRSSRDVRGVR
jgi:DNA-binding transcriptional LysR family regulator